MKKSTGRVLKVTIGLDLGDRFSHLCAIDSSGAVVREGRIPTTRVGLSKAFGKLLPSVVAIEAGAHSPWVSRELAQLGHEVLVAHPQKLRLIYENRTKSDRVDAQYLARLARFDRKLLHPVYHRSETAQADLSVLRSRDVLVRTRSLLINHVRGSVKAMGGRITKGRIATFHQHATGQIPQAVLPALDPALETIGLLTAQIREMDRRIEALCQSTYPETQLLRQVRGVGPIVALAFVLTLEDFSRFEKSRDVAPFLGLVPCRDQSGGSDPQKRITKHGDAFVRRLLVQAGHHILGPFGEDSNLRRTGLKIASRGGKSAKKRAIVAVARKLAVLLHHLWRSGEAYDPLHVPAHGGLPAVA